MFRCTHRLGAALSTAVLVVGVVVVVDVPGSAATPASSSTPVREQTTRATDAAGQDSYRLLWSVSAVSPSVAWAVGEAYRDGVTRSVILHWNGTTWARVPSPNPSASYSSLGSVSAISAHDAWAVGGAWRQAPLIAHWNGARWARVPVAGLDKWDGLAAVSAVSARDVWAVGSRDNGYTSDTIIWHWDGRSWAKVPSPNGRLTYNGLGAVSAVSATDAWAIGGTGDSTGEVLRALVLHWNGARWSRVSVPSPRPNRTTITAVSASSAHNAWAIGEYAGAKSHQLLLRWDGTSWSRVPGPKLAARWSLSDVDVLARRNAWATGEWYPDGLNGPRKTLMLHWNGNRWIKVASPSPLPRSRPWSVDADAADDAWVVGWHGPSVLILHWNGRRWSMSGPG